MSRGTTTSESSSTEMKEVDLPRKKSAIGVCCGVENKEDPDESLRSLPCHSVSFATRSPAREGCVDASWSFSSPVASKSQMGDEEIGVSKTGGSADIVFLGVIGIWNELEGAELDPSDVVKTVVELNDDNDLLEKSMVREGRLGR